MLHSLQPGQYVVGPELLTTSTCPECERPFIFGKGAMSLAHYHETDTGQLKRGLMCFCRPDVCCAGSIHECWASCIELCFITRRLRLIEPLRSRSTSSDVA